ncbi:hypothetical protein D3P08_04340 [Paenibacillus nanensis]|uniref:Uncharacterized protein n=1 Tax=Paenibacillus nanensis TaxID=393251 RepID=A0A3A1VEP7_9BACL|nr:hypothetical protein [Paenibacillus nanensis]RIX59388.1 hypothetical protein D3P08_04340 [Paenibacillus nanensis]
MSKIRLSILTAGLTAAAILFNGAGAGVEAASAAPAARAVNQIHDSLSIKEQAQKWAEELSAQERYKTWRNAEIHVSPMGPGLHSWLVELTQSDKTIVGYIVIYATEEGGFQLGEYGIGAYPLFNEQALKLSLLQLELQPHSIKAERLYGDPLHAAWRITSKQAAAVYYTDAISGEGLPIEKDEEWESEQKQLTAENSRYGLTETDSKLKETFGLMASFNPYGRMPWLTKKPLVINEGDYSSIFQNIHSNKEIRYTTESYKGKARQVWSVVGYDIWEGDQVYLALDSDEEGADRRYLPIELLVQEGQFYP